MNKSVIDIFEELQTRFNSNFTSWKKIPDNQLDSVMIGIRSLSAIGDILSNEVSSKNQRICLDIFDEIFSDAVSAIHLATNAMHKPANILLRRVLELGIAMPYLWDMPHMTYSWKTLDQNLGFSEMLKHLNSSGFREYVSDENSQPLSENWIPTTKCQTLYGELSDVVHGKISTFESSLPDRFEFSTENWSKFVKIIVKIIDILVVAYISRYNLSDQLFEKQPLAKRRYKLSVSN